MSDDKNLSQSEMFLKYDYPETKDMCKQFLTLITTVLVISLTFSDKIVGFNNASIASKWLVISSWTSFLLAIIFCGLGLLFVTMAAGEAAYNRTKNWKKVNTAYNMIVAAGFFFILGLVLLIGTAVTTTYNNTVIKEKGRPQTSVLQQVVRPLIQDAMGVERDEKFRNFQVEVPKL
jgi:hypothetical protein